MPPAGQPCWHSSASAAWAERAGDRHRPLLPRARRFDALVWVSAKKTALTTEGPAPAALIFHTLDDIAIAIALVLDRLVAQALTAQPTPLIIDNFETVADAQVLVFLRAAEHCPRC